MADGTEEVRDVGRAPGGSTWVLDEAGNALSPSNLARLDGAFARPDSVVFGWHYHFAGGADRSEVIFTSHADYVARLESARVGDHFTLYDLDAVAPHADVHIGASDSDSLGSSAHWRSLLQRLSTDEDVVIIIRNGDARRGSVEAVMDSPAYPQDEWLAGFDRMNASRRGELFLFDLTTLDRARNGAIESVTPPPEDRRLLALLDAKRPAEDGTVPTSGPY